MRIGKLPIVGEMFPSFCIEAVTLIVLDGDKSSECASRALSCGTEKESTTACRDQSRNPCQTGGKQADERHARGLRGNFIANGCVNRLKFVLAVLRVLKDLYKLCECRNRSRFRTSR